MSDYCYACIDIPTQHIENDTVLKASIMSYIQSHQDTDSFQTWENIVDVGEFVPPFGDCSITLNEVRGFSTLSLMDCQASDGYFEDIESHCMKNAVPFNRFSRGNYEADGDYIEWFRPGMTDLAFIHACDDSPMISISQYRMIMDEAPEELNAEEVLELLASKLNDVDPHSTKNSLKNYV